jgi:hypothetical protein
MKSYLFTIAVVNLCLLTVPSWAMNEDTGTSLNKAGRRAKRSVAAPAVTAAADCNSFDSELDDAQPKDKKSRTFFVYISNSSAAHSYREVVEKYDFSVQERNRECVKRRVSPEAFLTESKSLEKLCKTMKKALKKFEANQELIEICDGHSLLIKLNTRTKQSAKAVAKRCKKSVFVYRVFSDEADWNQFKGAEEAEINNMSRYE